MFAVSIATGTIRRTMAREGEDMYDISSIYSKHEWKAKIMPLPVHGRRFVMEARM